jgi:hypothetical protein
MDRDMECTYITSLGRMHWMEDPCVQTYKHYEGIARCYCMEQTEVVRSICPRYVKLIPVTDSGFGDPTFFPHTLRELCVGKITTRIAQCRTEVEFLACKIYIKGKLPKIILRALLNMHEWACIHWEKLGVSWISLHRSDKIMRWRGDKEMFERAGRNVVAIEFDPNWMSKYDPDFKFVCNMTN